VSRRQANRWSEQSDQQAAQEAAQYPPPQQQYAQPAPAVAAPDPIEQLTKLAALKEQGIITDAEFVVQKAKILGS